MHAHLYFHCSFYVKVLNVKVRYPSLISYQDIYLYSVSNFVIEIWIMIEILKISAFFEVNIWENLTSNLTINRFLHLLRVVSCIRGPVNLKLQKICEHWNGSCVSMSIAHLILNVVLCNLSYFFILGIFVCLLPQTICFLYSLHLYLRAYLSMLGLLISWWWYISLMVNQMKVIYINISVSQSLSLSLWYLTQCMKSGILKKSKIL